MTDTGLLQQSPLLVRSPQGYLDNGLLRPSESLQTELSKLVTNRQLGSLVVAVATLGPGPIQYAGFNDMTTVPAMSIGKVAALYAVFQLRAEAQAVVEGDRSSPSLPQLLKALTDRWHDAPDAVTRQLAAGPMRPRVDRIFDRRQLAKSGVPELAGWAVFQGQARDRRLRELASIDDRQHTRVGAMFRSGQLNFVDLVWLMARWSNNQAAHEVVDALGLPYVIALMVQSGLWRSDWGDVSANGPRIEGGLLLRDAYDGVRPIRKGWPGIPPRDLATNFNQATNARAACTFMAALDRGLIVSTDASRDMAQLLDKTLLADVSGTRSPIEEGLAPKRPVRVFSKLGLLEPNCYGDAGLVTPAGYADFSPYRDEANTTGAAKTASLKLRYALAILENHADSRGARGADAVSDLAVAIDTLLATAAVRTDPASELGPHR